MDTSRRTLMTAAGLAAAAQISPAAAQKASPRPSPLGAIGLDATTLGVRAGADDQSSALARALKIAADRNAPLLLPPGRYRVADVVLPDNTRLVGVPGATELFHAGGGAVLVGRGLKRLSLDGVAFNGQARVLADRDGLVALENIDELALLNCSFRDSGSLGVTLFGCRGRIADNAFAGMANAAIFSLDAKGLTIADNVVERCGNNGIQVWRSAKGDDGTAIVGNRLSDIRADKGGDGPYGNAVSVFRAGDVAVSGNHITGCAFSAIRGNSAANIQILGNSARRLGEVAIYSEFAFEGAVICGNVVDGASIGISVTNFNEGGRLAVVQGNVVRNLVTRRPVAASPEDVGGLGIGVEADCAVTGNAIDTAAVAGIAVGYGPYLRNVAVTGNTVRKAPTGVMVSVTRGAGSARQRLRRDAARRRRRDGPYESRDRRPDAGGSRPPRQCPARREPRLVALTRHQEALSRCQHGSPDGLRQGDRAKERLRKKIVFTGFVDDPQQTALFGRSVAQDHIDFLFSSETS